MAFLLLPVADLSPVPSPSLRPRSRSRVSAAKLRDAIGERRVIRVSDAVHDPAAIYPLLYTPDLGSTVAPTLPCSKEREDGEDRQRYYVNLGYAIRTLREELPTIFYKESTFDIYRYYSDYKVSDVSKDYRRMVAEFSKMGLFEKKGHGVFFSMCFMTFLLVTSVYGVVASSNFWTHMASAFVMGFLWIQSGWVGHDAGHYSVMMTPAFSRLAEILTGNCLTGISIGWWKYNHTAHHISCNSLDYDPDLQHIPLFAVSSRFFESLTSVFYQRKLTFDGFARFFVSYQHWTFYPVMCLARFNLYAQSILLLVSRKRVPHKGQELAGLAFFWMWYSFLLSFLPSWSERALYVAVCFTVTGLQHVQFTLSHFSAEVYVGAPTGNDWFEKQTKGTLDIKCSPWMDWFHGGLQFQVEHHLFPRLPRCHLRRIAPLVKELCKKHGLHYGSASFFEANRMTLATLRAAAMQARQLGGPVHNLVWEAVNTHG